LEEWRELSQEVDFRNSTISKRDMYISLFDESRSKNIQASKLSNHVKLETSIQKSLSEIAMAGW
jgi:hypothetical protein